MPNTVNHSSITINTSPEKVWEVLTTSEGITKCLPSIKVLSEWKLGSNVEYTCYSPDGSIMIWNDKQMIWNGEITEFETNKIYSVEYNGSGGIIKETYSLENQNSEIKLNFMQECIDEQTARNYIEGNEFTLSAIKKYLEK